MKKIILLILIFIFTRCFALDYNYYCSSSEAAKSATGVVMSSTGTNFLARKIAQKEIADALKKETGSKFKVKINSFWGTNIAKGEFNKFTAYSNNYSHRNFSAEKITVESICPYNKVSYKNNKLNFDSNMVLKFDAQLNQDNLSQVLKYKVNIANDKILFNYKLSAFGIKTTLSLKAGVKIIDNKIELCNIELNNKSINASKYLSLFDNFTNFKIDLDKNVKADIKIDNAKIKDSKLYITGFVLIPQS